MMLYYYTTVRLYFVMANGMGNGDEGGDVRLGVEWGMRLGTGLNDFFHMFIVFRHTSTNADANTRERWWQWCRSWPL